MAPKRSLASPSTPKAKKIKTNDNQASLMSFFKSPTGPKAATGSTSRVSSTVVEKGKEKTKEVIIIEDDEDEAGNDRITASVTSDLAAPTVPSAKSSNPARQINLEKELIAPTSYPEIYEDPLTFDLDEDGWWMAGAPAPYAFLAHILQTLANTRSRIIIMNTLTNALRIITLLHPVSLLPAVYLLSNSLSPPYSPIELGLGPSIITKVGKPPQRPR